MDGTLAASIKTLTWDILWDFPGGTSGREPTCQRRKHKMQFPSLGWEDPLEGEMATHCSILAWRIPWTEELAGYSPWGRKRVGHAEELDTTE